MELTNVFAELELESSSHFRDQWSDRQKKHSFLAILHRHFASRLRSLMTRLKLEMEGQYPDFVGIAPVASSRVYLRKLKRVVDSSEEDKVTITFDAPAETDDENEDCCDDYQPRDDDDDYQSRDDDDEDDDDQQRDDELPRTAQSALCDCCPDSLRLPRSKFAQISPAFSAMIMSENGFAESKSGRVHFPNISLVDFVLFLRLAETQEPANGDQCDSSVDTNANSNSNADVNSNSNKNSSLSGASPWLDSVESRCAKAARPSRIEIYERLNRVLRSLLSVVVFCHQYLIDQPNVVDDDDDHRRRRGEATHQKIGESSALLRQVVGVVGLTYLSVNEGGIVGM